MGARAIQAEGLNWKRTTVDRRRTVEPTIDACRVQKRVALSEETAVDRRWQTSSGGAIIAPLRGGGGEECDK